MYCKYVSDYVKKTFLLDAWLQKKPARQSTKRYWILETNELPIPSFFAEGFPLSVFWSSYYRLFPPTPGILQPSKRGKRQQYCTSTVLLPDCKIKRQKKNSFLSNVPSVRSASDIGLTNSFVESSWKKCLWLFVAFQVCMRPWPLTVLLW